MGYVIVNVGYPVDDIVIDSALSDNSTNAVQNKVVKEEIDKVTAIRTATLLAADWVGTEFPYTQEVSVAGMTDSEPAVDILFPSPTDAETVATIQSEFAKVYEIEALDGKIIAYAIEPLAVDITLQIKG